MKNFEGFGLSPALAESLNTMKYTIPTPIQAQAIPMALEGRDILGTAQTGTGKTAAFAIPLVEALLRNPQGSALVLTPTRELGKQVMDIIRQLLGPKSGIRSAFLIGGESMHKQRTALKNNPRLIVGTPGRINDHLRSRTMSLKDTNFLVLDETDRMLDMGFSVQIDQILQHVPRERQTLMFSATMPDNILKMSSKYLQNPARVAVGSTDTPAKNIKQETIFVENEGKYTELLTQLHARTGSVIVFVKTKHNTEKLAKKLMKDGFESDAIHGDLKQSRRDRVIREFREMQFRVLVATDVAARGLDIPHIEHVINYDLPQVAEDYIHRIGRTARAGAEGSALCLISGQDKAKWRAIESLMNPGQRSAERPERHGKKPHRGRSGGERKFSGNRDRKFGDDRRPKFGGDRRPKFAGERKFSNDRPQRADGDRFEKPAGDRFQKFDGEQRPARKFDGERPQRSDSNRPPRKFDGERSQRPQGERPQRTFDGDRPQRSERSEGARPPRKFDGKRKFEGARSDRPFGDRAPRKFDGPRSDRPAGDRPARKFSGERSQRPGGNRPPRKFDGEQRPRRFEGERTQRPDGARPPRKFDGPRNDRPAGDRPARKFDGERSYKPGKPGGNSPPRKFSGERKFNGNSSHKPNDAPKKRHTIGDMKRRAAAAATAS